MGSESTTPPNLTDDKTQNQGLIFFLFNSIYLVLFRFSDEFKKSRILGVQVIRLEI